MKESTEEILSQATARPWSVNDDGLKLGEVFATYSDKNPPSRCVIAHVHGYTGVGMRYGGNHQQIRRLRVIEAWANTRLIVKAVNEYEALCEVVKAVQNALAIGQVVWGSKGNVQDAIKRLESIRNDNLATQRTRASAMNDGRASVAGSRTIQGSGDPESESPAAKD